jgi:membrane protein DedA with SNARE-associated domain
MSPILFGVFTGIGSFFWNLLLVNLGSAAGNNWEAIVGKVGTVTTVIGAVIICAIGVACLLFIKKRIRLSKVDSNE